jgi:hypothetical protein
MEQLLDCHEHNEPGEPSWITAARKEVACNEPSIAAQSNAQNGTHTDEYDGHEHIDQIAELLIPRVHPHVANLEERPAKISQCRKARGISSYTEEQRERERSEASSAQPAQPQNAQGSQQRESYVHSHVSR